MSDEPISDEAESDVSEDDEASPAEETRNPDVPRPLAKRRRGMDPENRRMVLDACAIRTSSGWVTHFVLMTVLSILVAAMGLSADSAALVIGAMLLAPLMTPVLGTAASLSMAMGRPLWRSLFTLLVASLGGILLSYVVALFLRDGQLSNEILSRTSPDARDLVVALAAGAAGAYTVSRSDLSSSLPGVAIAVALVPPLAVVGLTLEAGRSDLARGALLLYTTNLAAIVVAGVVVFVLTGFVPPRRLATTLTQVVFGSMLAVGVMAAVAIPLTLASFRAADEARDREAVNRAVEAWLVGSNDSIDEVSVDGARVTVRISGTDQPPDPSGLVDEVRSIFGADAELNVRWTQAEDPLTPPEEPTDGELLAADVERVIAGWLGAADGDYDVSELEAATDVVRVDISSVNPPPSVAALRALLQTELRIDPRLEVTWTQQTFVEPDDGVETVDEVRTRLRARAVDWAKDRGVAVGDVDFDGGSLGVELVGESAPDALPLEAELLDELGDLGDGVDVTVWFTQRARIVPVPTPTPTPVPTPTPLTTPTPGLVIAFPTATATPS